MWQSFSAKTKTVSGHSCTPMPAATSLNLGMTNTDSREISQQATGAKISRMATM